MKKSSLRLAKRYARALFELYDHELLEPVKAGIYALRDLWLDNADLREALTNPAYPYPQRMEVLREVAFHARPSDEIFANFMVLLLKNDRLYYIPEIAVAFASLVDELQSLLNVIVVSAFPLSDAEKGEIEGKMRTDYSPMVSVSWEVNPALVGGLVIKAGDLVFDGSVQGSLEKIRKSLMV